MLARDPRANRSMDVCYTRSTHSINQIVINTEKHGSVS
jgi:hypothetical protein